MTRTLPSSKSSDPVLLDIGEAEQELQNLADALEQLSAEIDKYEARDSRRLKSLKLLTNEQMKYARDSTRVAMIKAQFGIVGHSWYNPDKDTEPKS